jgi:type II secretory pathway component GspD/PulD (secretin)
MDIFSALKILSTKGDISIVTSNGVKGTISIYLKDIDIYEALRMMLEMNDLAYMREGSIVKVMTAQEYERNYGKRFADKTIVEVVKLNNAKVTAIEKLLAPVKSKVGQLIIDPGTNAVIIIDTPENMDILKKIINDFDVKLETRVFSLNYTKAKEIAERLKNIVSLGVGDIQIDESKNLLMATDYPQKLDELAKLISSFDRRHQEVLIEAKIVSILLSDQYKMGVNWESIFSQIGNNPYAGKVVGNLAAAAGSNATGIQLNVGTIEVNNFKAVFDILESVGKTNLVSSPRVSALENEEAKVLVGTKEAYVTTTVTTSGTGVSTTAESVSFVEVGVKLYVTPIISDDGFITMKIRPEVSSVDRTIPTSQGNVIPIVRASQADTTIMVKDGVTVVLAGLMEEKEIKNYDGVPLLCKIPILGIPFRRTVTQKYKTELAIFLTPRIMTGDVSNIQENKKSLVKNK